MKILNTLASIAIVATLFSCKKENSVGNNNNNNVEAKTSLNVAYATDPLQNMDIYLPAGRTTSTTKVMIMIHGGAWASGDKAELNPFVDTLKRRLPDYAIFNINYRLSEAPNNLFPTQEMDVKAAIEYIYGKRAEYAISDKYVLVGASAGGHLAMLQGYKYLTPVKPKAIISLSGPSDLNDMYNHPAGGNPLLSVLLASVLGKTPAQDLPLYTNSSPVNFIGAGSPPTLLLYGDADLLVSPTQADFVKSKLQTAGVTNQYILYNGSAHVDTWSPAVFFDSFNKIVAFVTANVL
ncbi:MAG: alpha/beta hydrolase [Ferruginibacter sp.]